MNHMNANTSRSRTRDFPAAFVGIWPHAAAVLHLAGTTPRCDHCPPAQGAPDDPCAPAMQADCSLPDLTPVSVDGLPTAHVAAGVLTTLPAAIGRPPDIAAARHAENAARRALPPLALRPAVLLI